MKGVLLHPKEQCWGGGGLDNVFYKDSKYGKVWYLKDFPVLQTAIINRLRSFVLLFFIRIFKTRQEYGFLQNPPVEGTVNSMEHKTKIFC
jgi:hypothetical protein